MAENKGNQQKAVEAAGKALIVLRDLLELDPKEAKQLKRGVQNVLRGSQDVEAKKTAILGLVLPLSGGKDVYVGSARPGSPMYDKRKSRERKMKMAVATIAEATLSEKGHQSQPKRRDNNHRSGRKNSISVGDGGVIIDQSSVKGSGLNISTGGSGGTTITGSNINDFDSDLKTDGKTEFTPSGTSIRNATYIDIKNDAGRMRAEGDKVSMSGDGIIRGGTVKFNGRVVGQGTVDLAEVSPDFVRSL